MLNAPYKDFITDGDKPQKITETWLDWIKQIPFNINFISPLFAGNQSASLDMTTKPGLIIPWPGFLILSWSTAASGLTLKLPAAPRNSILVIATQVGVANNVVINATWTLTPGTWITLISDGTNWTKIMAGSL